ncbi:hypothetical protein KOEU_12830 [Komagataeibacter europaeus]|uniref:Transcriptional regulator-like domain-containing protein n=3 Tax=Acetobacteraceae TaxID=433 RepID=A0A850P4N0_9PROT|nr:MULTISPECIES: DUF6499 domain-containing protein [Acetobacteraceae]MBV1824968.1 hypothetical protein [Komagataeibacter oboediens]GCD75968.1 hypothetical protein NBRC3299_2260 [Acetobacter pasteurianus NBRC 3299]AZV39025.1 hypothetical protein CXP35_09740 [Komagataeibacter xylinus]KON65442.1 hypothetical protein KOEU_12830 [Komagataeibacter europaeus]NVN37719.1 hypothetical protein [Komagataeibacter swingsii]
MPAIYTWDATSLRRTLEPLDPAGFAQEWLRRNPRYHDDYDRTVPQARGDPDLLIAMARRWGLDFPC